MTNISSDVIQIMDISWQDAQNVNSTGITMCIPMIGDQKSLDKKVIF